MQKNRFFDSTTSISTLGSETREKTKNAGESKGGRKGKTAGPRVIVLV